jgi:hypothetical protein
VLSRRKSTLIQTVPVVKYKSLGNSKFGIRIYQSELNGHISADLDRCLTHEQSCNTWSLAAVGYEQIPDASYRNCYDFKMREDQVESVQEKVGEIYKITTGQIRACVEHYSRDYRINMGFMEAVNFVKYSTGEHFSYHSDHAYHYVCTVSTVAYFNDDYEGGELHFDKFDLRVKPQEGQIIVFPSTFLYSHASLPVTSGTKFAAVTMFDYNNEYSEFRKNLLSKH